MSDGFYRAFEERYRGTRDLIKGRLAAYLPFVASLAEAYPTSAAIDLGCGRGEWLELLSESGLKATGVDLDAAMLEACHQLGLKVEQGDAISYLLALPDESQVIVSAFHVVEHITFDQLQTLVAEALRVLKPGGLLIMETPNPENIVVATRNFYLDPTHQRPIPSMLLAFVAEYAGFARVKTLRLQESKELTDKSDVSLQDVFAGASPDYAIVAQKHAPDNVLELTNAAFSVDYGLSLDNLLSRWDSRFNRLETKAQQAEAKAEQAEAALEAVRLELNQIKQSNHFHRQLAEARQQQFLVIQNSISWKITKPLRAFKRMAGRDFSLLRELPKRFRAWIQRIPSAPKAYAIVKQPIEHGIRFVVQRPRFKRLGMFLLKPLPTIEARLKEKRVAQVRSDFMIQSLNLKSSAGYEHNYQQPKAVNVLSLISADKSSLTVDEILFCIRVELAEMHKEKRSDF